MTYSPQWKSAARPIRWSWPLWTNQSSNDKAATAASELVSKGCSVVLGSYGSGVSIAGSDTFKNAGIPVIGVTCTNPQVTEGNTHYFRICFLVPFQCTVLANFAVDNFQARPPYTLTNRRRLFRRPVLLL